MMIQRIYTPCECKHIFVSEYENYDEYECADCGKTETIKKLTDKRKTIIKLKEYFNTSDNDELF